MKKSIISGLALLMIIGFYSSCQEPVLFNALTAVKNEALVPTPEILSVTPEAVGANQTVLAYNQSIVITFSQPMDSSTLVLGGTLASEAGTSLFSTGSGGDDTVLTIPPTDYWRSGSARTFTVSCISGQGKALYSSSGTTVESMTFSILPPGIVSASFSPADGAVINSDAVLTVVFDREMDESSLVLGGNISPGTILPAWSSYSNNAHQVAINASWVSGDNQTLTLQCRELGGNSTEILSEDYTVLDGVIYVSDPSNTTNPGSSSNSGSVTFPLSRPADALARADILFGSIGEVWIAEGSYYINDEYPINLIPGISLSGGYSEDFLTRNPVVYISELKDGRTSGIYSLISGGTSMDSTTVVSGFTLTGGSAGSQCNLIDLQNGASPRIEGNRFASFDGSSVDSLIGVATANASTSPLVINNKMIFTGAASAILSNGSALRFYNNTVLCKSSANDFGVVCNGTGTEIVSNNIFFSENGAFASIYIASGAGYPESIKNNLFFGWDVVLSDDGANETTITEAETRLDLGGTIVSGNIAVDPALTADLDLTGSSPVSVTAGGLDGSASGWGFTTDFYGDTRTGDGSTGWSIGADEQD